MTGNTTYGNVEERQNDRQSSIEGIADKQYLIACHACLARSVSLDFYFLSLGRKHLILVEDGRLDYNGRVRHARFEVLFSCEL